MSKAGEDAKFFQRGKIEEFRKELQEAETKDKKFIKRKTALKKIVANITMGNDMSPLFPDVVQCLVTPSLEIKKMVYLFLVSYGRSRPNQVEYVIPAFLEASDCHDRNPLIRALAIRTMSYIPLQAVLEALVDPLRASLRDKDPYVRKTAAICVAKLFFHDAVLVERESFIDMLRDLLADANSTVVSNAVAALMEISERSDKISLKLNFTVANKLVMAMGECSEWGQIYILDSLLSFVPQTCQEAEQLADRIVIRLQHANSAVVLTSIKVLLFLMNYMDNKKVIEFLCRKMGPPLVTLLSSGPEVQYVALRNILLIIQRRPTVLRNDVKVFFCKYNDPIYVKLAKLEIMYRLAREENAKEVLAELQEYATEVDIDFVRKAVRSIGRLAIKVEPASDMAIQVLLELIDNKVSYVLQEAVIVIKDIFRRYPGKYEGILPKLCQNIDVLDEPEAKAAMIWVIGQYAFRIDNSEELLDDLLYSFLEESAEVQLSLLTASVKLFVYKSNSTRAKDLVHKVLKWATEEVDNPDLRDRGFMYWRLLAISPATAGEIVLAEKPPISTDTDRMERGALDQLLLHTGTLASIYHKNPETFIRNARGKALVDSPALNENSRRVLISLPDAYMPGPAPNIPPPPTPSTKPRSTRDTSPDSAGDVSNPASPAVGPPVPHDPYANLESVFGGAYDADVPRPMTDGPGRRGTVVDDEDLLF
ncbi:Adaptor protein complex beta subunit [Exidia glandulosa HHB12029]|uniref:AP complex subunit beta n=1 Tax=Exidia glandulosa HHB12029 TaxID=1314781 RepID=A0A165GVE5_EXIGL|nr:Adaptor protein complex beta subunit [Exidia glandulosa HHB12029]